MATYADLWGPMGTNGDQGWMGGAGLGGVIFVTGQGKTKGP